VKRERERERERGVYENNISKGVYERDRVCREVEE
jgi:hypothetical protein